MNKDNLKDLSPCMETHSFYWGRGHLWINNPYELRSHWLNIFSRNIIHTRHALRVTTSRVIVLCLSFLVYSPPPGAAPSVFILNGRVSGADELVMFFFWGHSVPGIDMDKPADWASVKLLDPSNRPNNQVSSKLINVLNNQTYKYTCTLNVYCKGANSHFNVFNDIFPLLLYFVQNIHTSQNYNSILSLRYAPLELPSPLFCARYVHFHSFWRQKSNCHFLIDPQFIPVFHVCQYPMLINEHNTVFSDLIRLACANRPQSISCPNKIINTSMISQQPRFVNVERWWANRKHEINNQTRLN